MNDITKTPTADLIAELLELEKNAKVKPVSLECVYARQEKANRHSDICYELDRRCEGIYVGEDGFPYFGDFKFEGKNGTCEPKHDAQWVGVTIPLAELRDLLTWLLTKEGGKG